MLQALKRFWNIFNIQKNVFYAQNKYSDNKLWKFDSYLATLIVFCSEKYHNLDKKSSKKKKVALDPPTDYFDLPIKMSGKTSSITWDNFRLAEFFFIKFFYKIHRAISCHIYFVIQNRELLLWRYVKFFS